MRRIRKILSSLPKYLLWAVLSTLFWMWIFTLITDTSAEKKVVLYADVSALADPELAVRLEEAMPEGIRMIKAHNFSYSMFSGSELMAADIYIVAGSSIPDYYESFLPLPDRYMSPGEETFSFQNTVYGLRVYDAASGKGAASSYITYPGGDHRAEDYYLCFGVNSLHCGELDEAAFAIADVLLSLN